MRRYLHSLAMCQSMFCAIPCPWNLWDEEAREHMLLFLPLIGLEIGLLFGGVAWIMRMLAVPSLLYGPILCACPLVLTGCIHLDGFMDVTDAVKSWRDLERRREILKDSHVGSFAVIGCILLLLLQSASFAAASADADLRILVLVPVVSRCGSALAIQGLKPMSTSQYASQARSWKRLLAVAMILCAALTMGFVCCGRYGFVLLGCAAGYALALRRGYRSLDGVNGDVAGYALCCAELCAALVYALL